MGVFGRPPAGTSAEAHHGEDKDEENDSFDDA